MDEVHVGNLSAVHTTAGFYLVAIGGTNAFLGTISPLSLPWFAAFTLPRDGAPEPKFLGAEPSIEGALGLFAPPEG